METGERLAAYLAGDLDTVDARALEAELAGDPSLRARLARMRRLEEQLRGLPDVEPPSGFSERLAAAVRDELERRPVGGDELAARRQRRLGLPAWLPAAAGAAAALAVVVGIGTSLSGLRGGDDAADEGAATVMMEAPGDGAAGAGTTATGPVIVDADQHYDSTSVQALAADEVFAGIVDQQLSGSAAEATADEYRRQLGDPRVAARMPEDDTATQESAGDAGDAADTGADVPVEGSDEDGAAAVDRCLDQLLVDEEPLIPVYAELARFEGEDAIVYGIVSPDPADGSYTRVEIWVVDRTSCEVVFFTQQAR